MMTFEGLKFKKGTSVIHTLDPRTKFILTLAIFILALLFTKLYPLVLLFLLQIPLVLIARVQREWLKSLRGMTLISVMIFGMNLLVDLSSSNWVLTYKTLESPTAITLRFIILVTSFSIFFLTTSPDDLSLALEKSHIPYDLCFAFTSAIRFIPVLANEAQTIIDAQRSRGLELDKGSIVARIKNYVPILIPLIIGAIRRSLELADAMEIKAFKAKKKRTSLYSLEMKAKDYAVLVMLVICLTIIIYIRYFSPSPIVFVTYVFIQYV